ncbi:hypothetical protein N1078_16960 [Pseudomonas sp. MIL19]|uniref:hypothetical protein n=1 Tax=Pseudomonas sp. MIL19 TaxID=2976979 RepID=UPI002364A686|nr:hypothetical protein [Pseudomonas sp. MIL19]MDD2162259.1 hypothetical protein [Pseudomonas sp. MIL19]
MTQTVLLEKNLRSEQVELRETISYSQSIGATGINGVSVEVLKHYFALLDQTANQVTT